MDPGSGGIQNVPEFAFEDRKCNPFAVDVWCLGFLIQVYFTEVLLGHRLSNCVDS
jgi:ABC-type arginine transport system permease subunit